MVTLSSLDMSLESEEERGVVPSKEVSMSFDACCRAASMASKDVEVGVASKKTGPLTSMPLRSLSSSEIFIRIYLLKYMKLA